MASSRKYDIERRTPPANEQKSRAVRRGRSKFEATHSFNSSSGVPTQHDVISTDVIGQFR